MRSAPLRPQPKSPPELPPHDDSLKRMLLISVVVHVALLLVFTVRAVLFPSEIIPMESTIRVDMVALPDKKVAQLPKAAEPAPPVEKPAPPKPEPAAPPPVAKIDLPKPAPAPIKPPPPVAKNDAPKVDLNKNKNEQTAALKRLEAIERLKRAAEQQEAREAQPKKSTSTTPAAPTVIKGNEISKGSSLTGLSKIDHENYLESVHQQVSKHLNLPRWLSNASLVAKVQLFIDAQGNVVKKVLTRSSKQPVFDDKLMQAIDAASPLPRPPSDLANLLAVEGMEIEFAPTD